MNIRYLQGLTSLPIILGGLALLLCACGIQPNSLSSGIPYRDPLGENVPLTLKTVVPIDREAVIRWKPDVFLIEGSVTINTDALADDINVPYAIGLHWGSKEEKYRYLATVFRRDTTLNMVIGYDTRPGNSNYMNGIAASIESSDWSIDSPEAWQIFVSHGGRAFLSEQRPLAETLRCGLDLRRQNPWRLGPVLWQAYCWSFISIYSQKTIQMSIDAMSGQVISILNY